MKLFQHPLPRILALSLGLVLITIATAFGADTNIWFPTNPMSTPRYGHTATLLANGKIMIVGGCQGAYCHDLIDPRPALASAEFYDPVSSLWTATGSLKQERYLHTATLLPSGKVLVVGGSRGGTLASAEIYDPASGQWTSTGALREARFGHTATLLSSGKVLVAGGGSFDGSAASAELYDPQSGLWKSTGTMQEARMFHTATLLSSGQVLVVGGVNQASAELYDPDSGTWTPTDSMSVPRYYHTATLLPSGKILVTGGSSGESWMGGGEALASTELYDPTLGAWMASNNMAQARYRHTATLLPSGQVLVVGGGHNGEWGADLPGGELYEPSQETWKTTRVMVETRQGHTATFASGQVLVTGGNDSKYNNLSSAELYRPNFTKPDFLITSITLTRAAPKGTFEATVTVQNQSNIAGDAGKLTVWPHRSEKARCRAIGGKSVQVGKLKARQSKTFTIAGLKAGDEGSKTFRAFLDSDCKTQEENEANNQLTQGYHVFSLSSLAGTWQTSTGYEFQVDSLGVISGITPSVLSPVWDGAEVIGCSGVGAPKNFDRTFPAIQIQPNSLFSGVYVDADSMESTYLHMDGEFLSSSSGIIRYTGDYHFDWSDSGLPLPDCDRSTSGSISISRIEGTPGSDLNYGTPIQEDFSDGVADHWVPVKGTWTIKDGVYQATSRGETSATVYYDRHSAPPYPRP